MRLPNVLLIGAMKAGTTTLYMDLVESPAVFLAEDKEPHALVNDVVLTAEGQQRYAAHYSQAGNDQILIDASTGYSKRPDIEGVAARAAALLPKNFQVIYLVRHPIDRIVSQHYHEFSGGLVGPDIDAAVRLHSRFVDYSKYAYQLTPWVESIGIDRIRVVKFEDYVSRRREVLQQLGGFLGLSHDFGSLDEGKVYNRSQGKPVRNRFWTRIYSNDFYRNRIRPLIPVKLRLTLREMLLPRAPERPAEPQPETINWLRAELAQDVFQLSELLNKQAPLWDDFLLPATNSDPTPASRTVSHS